MRGRKPGEILPPELKSRINNVSFGDFIVIKDLGLDDQLGFATAIRRIVRNYETDEITIVNDVDREFNPN